MKFFGFDVDAWTLLGFFAQFLFLLSFVIQWYKSERMKKSHVPWEFWALRIFASVLLMVYVLHRRDIVFFISTFLQIVIYVRNMQLMRREEPLNS